MPVEHQSEFLFVDGWAPDAKSQSVPTLDDEIAAAWRVPMGRRARIVLREHDVPVVEGVLEAAEGPAFPFDGRRLLPLRVGRVEFTNRQIESWTLL
jgi:hypothetical protein